jgi:thiol-disulfide isomerase/thioredoxin
MKKLLLILVMIGLIVCLIPGCTPTAPPAEGEGEGEGEGEPEEVNRVVVVEIFMAEDCSTCEVIEPYLEQLAEEYGTDEMILAEVAVWGKYSSPENYDRFKWYFPNSAGTPYTSFNGLNQTVTGNSSYSVLKSKVDSELAKTAKIAISANRSSSNSLTTITGTIKNVYSSTISNLAINGMIFKNYGEVGFNYSVTDIFEEGKIDVSSLAPDESFEFTFTLENYNWDGNQTKGVIFVQLPNAYKKEILQALYVE